jgi:hypothetical protein
MGHGCEPQKDEARPKLKGNVKKGKSNFAAIPNQV